MDGSRFRRINVHGWISVDDGRTMSCVAGSQSAASDDGPRASMVEAVSETYNSALALVHAFGSPVVVPSWWPADIGEISYSVDRFPGRASYRVGSTRRDGVPLFVIGRVEASEARRSPRDWLPGEWHEPVELARMEGLIGRVGIPPRLQAFVYDGELTISLIGYDTEDEIIRAVNNFRRPCG